MAKQFRRRSSKATTHGRRWSVAARVCVAAGTTVTTLPGGSHMHTTPKTASALGRAEREEDRIRQVFKLPAHAPIPRVGKETLQQYHEYLAEKLTFPFKALYAETKPPVRQLVRYLTVLGMSDDVRRRQFGLFCKVRLDDDQETELPLADLGIQADDPNRELIDDYLYWLWNAN